CRRGRRAARRRAPRARELRAAGSRGRTASAASPEFYGLRLHRGGAGDVGVVRRILVVLLLLTLLAGCGSGNGSAPSSATSAAPSIPEGFTVRTVRDEGFSIAVPRRWRSLDASTALTGSSAKRFERDNPAAAGAVAALSRPDSPMKFV